MSKIPLNIYGDPLSAFYGLDVLGDSHSLQEAWIIVDNASSPWISSRLRVQLSRVSGISSQWDNERTLDTLPGNFPQRHLKFTFKMTSHKLCAWYYASCTTTRSVHQTIDILMSPDLAAYVKTDGDIHDGACCIDIELEALLRILRGRCMSAADQAILDGLDANAGKQSQLFRYAVADTNSTIASYNRRRWARPANLSHMKGSHERDET
jgi:hypothetical protein